MPPPPPATRRLAVLRDAVTPPGDSRSYIHSAPAASTVAAQPPRLLTLEQLRQFVRDGFIVLQIDDLPLSLHQGIWETSRQIEEEAQRETARRIQQAAAAGDADGARVWLATQRARSHEGSVGCSPTSYRNR